MTPCEQYMENPEAHREHLAECPFCRALEEELDAAIEAAPMHVNAEALPLAPWEGASHRTWPLVAAGAAAVLILAFVLFLAAGISPLRGITEAVVSNVPSLAFLLNLSELAGGALHNAPPAWHIAVAVSFVVINTVLVLLLRRAPKGADV